MKAGLLTGGGPLRASFEARYTAYALGDTLPLWTGTAAASVKWAATAPCASNIPGADIQKRRAWSTTISSSRYEIDPALLVAVFALGASGCTNLFFSRAHGSTPTRLTSDSATK